MIFDLFHSISDPIVGTRKMGERSSVAAFLRQVQLAEFLGMNTVWCAESHFSSETQKTTSVATIPYFRGEVGINSDSFQLFHLLAQHTKGIHFGTAIHNIVGGSGGPIASADRVNFLRFCNENFWPTKRILRIGVAAGRFPYQNTAFGILPRDQNEEKYWLLIKRYIFLEALEIFLRLLKGEVVNSNLIHRYHLTRDEIQKSNVEKFAMPQSERYEIRRRWEFENVSLVPSVEEDMEHFRIVLGSQDPQALALARKFWDVDLFHLSFTSPEQIEQLHCQLASSCLTWRRERLPRTVLIFIDKDRKKARELADNVLNTYIDAMHGTAQVPKKSVLLERALVGDASEIREQLDPANPRRFHLEDRLMLWFEFNQLDGAAIEGQMKYFWQDVVEKMS